MGNTEGSRRSLATAVECSEREGNLRTLLISQSELAELDWRHGDEHARLAAIDRVSNVLDREYAPGSFIEERAGLSYQLGAALIVAGRREEAKQVLHAGMELGPGDYWSMRLANALGTAEYYLGHFDEALRLMGEAWTRAERGGFDTFKARIMSNRAGITYAVGGFKKAVDYHETASLWARRTGSRFEFIAACQGAAVNQMLLADYEGAIAHVQQGGMVAKEIKSEYHIVKTIDLEALVEFFVGNWKRSRDLVDRAAEEDARIGQSDVSPRIDLLRGRLARAEGRSPEAERFLRSAEGTLTETQDWEDLPGVQIELELLRAERDPDGAIVGILGIAESTKALTVQLAAGVAISEIVVNRVIDDGESWNYLTLILGRADEAGAMEAVWRINFALGEIALRRGDRKGAATRFAQSLRGFREVADELSAERRALYLDTPHARHLLARVT
jgi:tetratricopeptide (TPR) repeat protein